MWDSCNNLKIRWSPSAPPSSLPGQDSGVSTHPSPPPAYTKLAENVYDPNSDELKDWEDRNN